MAACEMRKVAIFRESSEKVKKVMCVGPGVRKCVFTTCTVRESVYYVRTRIIRPHNTRHDLFPDPDATLDT